MHYGLQLFHQLLTELGYHIKLNESSNTIAAGLMVKHSFMEL